MDHPKLAIPQQIENMKRKGITFDICPEAEARRFLEHNTYYFKLKAYAKNYDTYRQGEKAGQYINLDFAYLRDLSTIDAYLRKVIIGLSLDLEHFLKVKMLADLNMVDEDGYTIVDELFAQHADYQEEIERKQNTSTCSNIVAKYHDHWAAWSIVELMSFGQFIELYQLFYERNRAAFKNNFCVFLFPVRMIRNAAAHNNCLINQLRPPFSREIKPTYEVKHRIVELLSIKKENKSKVESRLQHPTIHDFVTLLLLYNEIVPEPTRSKGMKEVSDLFEKRMVKHKEYYQKEQILQRSHAFVAQIVDELCKK